MLDSHNTIFSRSWWPRDLRLGSTATCLLGLRVRIPPVAWMSVPCECLHVVRWRSLQRAYYSSRGVLTSAECVECDRITTHSMSRHTKAVEPLKKKAVSVCTCLSLHSNYLNLCQDSGLFHIKENLNLFPRSVMHMHYMLSSVSLRHRVHKMYATCSLCALLLSV